MELAAPPVEEEPPDKVEEEPPDKAEPHVVAPQPQSSRCHSVMTPRFGPPESDSDHEAEPEPESNSDDEAEPEPGSESDSGQFLSTPSLGSDGEGEQLRWPPMLPPELVTSL